MDDVHAHIPKLNPDIEFLPIDTASKNKKYLLTVRGEREFEISETVHDLLRMIDSKRTSKEIAFELSHRGGSRLTEKDIDNLIMTSLVPYGIVFFNESEFKASFAQKSYLCIKIPLFPQRAILPLANVLQVLFVKPFFYCASLALFFSIYIFSFSRKSRKFLSVL